MDLLAPEIPVTAVVLTHDRPVLAQQVVRNLVEVELIPPERVVLVINGVGGLLDRALQARIHVLALAENVGPAGGFAAGIRYYLENFESPWLYLCEDDVGLFDLPTPRVRVLVQEVEAWEAEHRGERVGGVVAYGRRLDARTGLTVPQHPQYPEGLEEVDVAPWGGSLISRRAVEAGVLPDPEWFFGFEDFDYWLGLKKAGFCVLLDCAAARTVTERAFGAGRSKSFEGRRPPDDQEPWRRYYEARNFLHLARRHGKWTWYPVHFLKSIRRWQSTTSKEGKRAVVAGFVAGSIGSLGRNDRYLRTTGELRSESHGS